MAVALKCAAAEKHYRWSWEGGLGRPGQATTLSSTAEVTEELKLHKHVAQAWTNKPCESQIISWYNQIFVYLNSNKKQT